MTSPAHSHPLIDDEVLRRRLVASARYWLAYSDEAEDLVQEVWLRTAQGLPALAAGGREAWLVTVLRHLCIDAWRRQQRHNAALAQLANSEAGDLRLDSPEALADQAQRVEQALQQVVDSLPADDVAVVLLHEVFGYSHAELGMLVGRSEAASRQQLHRALQRMRRHGSSRTAVQEDDAYLFALCQLALARRDPAGLVAVLRSTRPQTMALLAPAADDDRGVVQVTCVPRAQWIRFGNLIALLSDADGLVVCVPLMEANGEPLVA